MTDDYHPRLFIYKWAYCDECKKRTTNFIYIQERKLQFKYHNHDLMENKKVWEKVICKECYKGEEDD
jgi:hypothetical protein